MDTTTATNSDLTVGDEVTFTFASGPATFEVVGLYEPAGFFTGYSITNEALEDAGVTIGDTFVYVKADDDADLDALQERDRRDPHRLSRASSCRARPS